MNIPTFLVASLVAFIFIAIIVTGIRNKKKGKSSCSCGGSCGACPMSEKCHSDSKK